MRPSAGPWCPVPASSFVASAAPPPPLFPLPSRDSQDSQAVDAGDESSPARPQAVVPTAKHSRSAPETRAKHSPRAAVPGPRQVPASPLHASAVRRALRGPLSRCRVIHRRQKGHPVDVTVTKEGRAGQGVEENREERNGAGILPGEGVYFTDRGTDQAVHRGLGMHVIPGSVPTITKYIY